MERRKGKGNEVIRGRNIDFLGYCFNKDNIRLRKSIKQTFARKNKNISTTKTKELRAAYWGWCKWGRCTNLWNKITNTDMSFSDFGISGRIETKDGLKFFDVNKVRIDSVLNLQITVLDFERNVETRHGSGRYVIKIMAPGFQEPVKIITNSFTMKNMLDQAEKAGVPFPITTIIRKRDIGDGRSDYYFE